MQGLVVLLSLLSITQVGRGAEATASASQRGTMRAEARRPEHFPHRIWAACDFEGQTPDYGWFGRVETNNIPNYPGNATALAAALGPYKDFSAVMTGINPVPGPRMGKVNQLYLRYHLVGGNEGTFQHFSLTREDNWHIKVAALEEGRWAELTLNFTRDARRNDGSAELFGEGERMDDFKVFAGLPADAAKYELRIDDVIFFANDAALPPEPEPFPNRVIFLARSTPDQRKNIGRAISNLRRKFPQAATGEQPEQSPARMGKANWSAFKSNRRGRWVRTRSCDFATI